MIGQFLETFSEIINLFKLCIYLGFSFTQDTKVVITLTVLFHSPSLTLSSYAKCNGESGEALQVELTTSSDSCMNLL